MHGGGREESETQLSADLVDRLVDLRTVDSLQEHLTRVGNDPNGDDYQTNYALRLEDGDSIIHNRFVVPEWGTLRLNLHTPELRDADRSDTLRVFMKGTEPGDDWQSLGAVDLKLAENPDSSESAVGYYDYVNGEYIDPYTYSIAYGVEGFETFHLAVPEEFRGRSAMLRFELSDGSPNVYLDDVFFKSEHLKLGNPSFSRPFEDSHRENYLIEKPQYSLSYNDAIKGPNWVSWQLDRSWLGEVRRGDVLGNGPGEYPIEFPRPVLSTANGVELSAPDSTYPGNYQIDYPWIADTSLPNDWQKTQGPDYRLNQRGFDRGHMTAAANRNRNFKDYYATFLTTNVLPQHQDINQRQLWRRLEEHSRTLVVNQDRELSITAGGFDYSQNQPRGHSDLRTIHNRISVNQQDRVVLDSEGTLTANPKNIGVPNYVWKIIISLEPGQEVVDITYDTEVIAVMFPNRPTRVTPDDDYRLPATQLHPNGFLPDGITSWNDWQQWRVSVDYLEELTGYDFLSNVPELIQDEIEQRHDNPYLT